MRKTNCRSIRAVLAAALALACGCSYLGGLVGTQIEVKGGQRSLEEQVLGAFQQLGDEVYLLASVRSIDPVSGAPTAPPPMTRSEAGALRARQRMEFNRDDIAQFLRQGYVGEGSDGLLAPFPDQEEALKKADPRQFELVQAVAKEENEDRLTVMQRIVDTNPDLRGEEGLLTVKKVLAAKHREVAEPGTKVQLPDGTWAIKGPESPG
jgi:hypothetical protein